jgi:gas vesicle protein
MKGDTAMNERIYYSREAEMQAQRARTVMAVAVMVVGMGVGTIMALLFAPKPGRDTREALADSAGHMYENSRESTGKMIESLRKDFDKFRSDVEERLQKA